MTLAPHSTDAAAESTTHLARNPSPLPSAGVRTLRTIAEHVACVLERVRATAPVRVALAELADAGPGLVLAERVTAAAPVPPFDHSAVDGYALARPPATVPQAGPGSAEATMTTAAVVRGVRAGDDAGVPLRSGEAVRVMTGAPLPAGADVVVPVEHSSTGRFRPGRDGDETSVTLTLPRRDNIRRRGEDLAAGAVLGEPGDDVGPALVAAAAAAGLAELVVHRRPRVAVLSTGSELRPTPSPAADPAPPAPATIPDSNSLMLAAIARATGAEVLRRGGVPDDAASLRAALDDVVAAGADLIVTTGGVSAGAWDVVRQLLLEGGSATDVDLTGVDMRPGRPQALAAWRGVPWIGLPGTPTAAFTAAHLFVRPALDALRGAARPGLPGVTAVIALDDSCDRTRVLPVRVEAASADRVAVPLATGGHALAALLAADGLAVVPPGPAGAAPVEVLLVREVR